VDYRVRLVRLRLAITATLGLLVLGLAFAAEFLVGSFWSRHALFTSLVANLVVLAVTLAVVNEWIDRRDRRRWSVLAQYVMFQLAQAARATWTSLIELLERHALDPITEDVLLAAARRVLDTAAVSAATSALLADDERRALLRDVLARLAEHGRGVIVSWAAVMVGSGPYAELFDSHVELQGRLELLRDVLMARDPPAQRSVSEAKLSRSSMAAEHSVELNSERSLHNQVVTIAQLAVHLDYRARSTGFELVPIEWWRERTQAAVAELSALGG
jgi:hypothetical protein